MVRGQPRFSSKVQEGHGTKFTGKWRRLHFIAASYKCSLGPCTRTDRPGSYALQFWLWYTIQRELVQIEASVQNFCLLEAASSLLPPHTSLAPGDFGQGGAAASGRSGAGVERRWWRRPITRLQRLVFCIMRQGRCAEHASRALMCAGSEQEAGHSARRGMLHAERSHANTFRVLLACHDRTL